MTNPIVVSYDLSRWAITFRSRLLLVDCDAVQTVDVLAKTQVEAEIAGSRSLQMRFGGLWTRERVEACGAPPEVVYEGPVAEESGPAENELRDVIECEICGADVLNDPKIFDRHETWHLAQSYTVWHRNG